MISNRKGGEKMKLKNPKLVIGLLVIYLTLVIGHLSFAQSLSIGCIDVQKVFKESKEAIGAQKELSKKEEAFRKEFADSQKKLDEAQKTGKNQEETEKMRTDLEGKLGPKRAELLKLNEQLTARLQIKILDAVKNVAKKIGLELVLDKQVVIVGGTDITDLTISELNK